MNAKGSVRHFLLAAVVVGVVLVVAQRVRAAAISAGHRTASDPHPPRRFVQVHGSRQLYRSAKMTAFLIVLNTFSGSVSAMSSVLNALNGVLGWLVGKRPRDLPVPAPNLRLRVEAAPMQVSPPLQAFRKHLAPSCWQHGTLDGAGDPLLYLYMAKALRAFPSLAKHAVGIPHSALATADLFAIPGRDSHVADVMYGSVAPPSPPAFCTADLREWRDWLGGRLAAWHAAGALPQPLAALTQYATTQPRTVSPHCAWLPTPGFDGAPVFSFAGVAWMAVYHLGAVSALRERWDLTHPSVRLCGTSSGAIVAATAGSGALTSDALVRCFEQWADANGQVLGPISHMTRILAEGLHNLTPPDAHSRLHHRLKVVVSSTAPPGEVDPPSPTNGEGGDGEPPPPPQPSPLHQLGFQHILGEDLLPHRAHVTEFPSRDSLIATVEASCHVPGYSGGPVGKPLPEHLVHAQHPAARQRAGQAAAPSSVRHATSLMFDGALTDNFPRWHGDVEWVWMAGLGPGGTPPPTSVFDPSVDGFTATVCPAPGFGTISPPFELRDSDCMHAGAGTGTPLPQQAGAASPGPCAFDVDRDMAFGGWAAISALMPVDPEQWWGAFFAGRAHTLWWMRAHGWGPRPPSASAASPRQAK